LLIFPSLEISLFYFPEMARSLPIELSYAEGEGKNVTTDRKLLDNLDYTPERQSEKAEKESK